MNKKLHFSCLLTGLLLFVNSQLTFGQNQYSTPAISINQQANQKWSIIGPGAGGGVFIPTISPFDNNFVFAKGDMTGAFVTYDGGKKWEVFNLMSVVQDFEFDPKEPDVVYASSRGYLYEEDRGSGLTMLYKSENRGKTWKVIYPDIEKIAPIEKLQSMSFLPSELVKDMPDGSIDLIKVDPVNNNRIYLGLSPLRPYIEKLPENAPHFIFLMGTENKGKDWKLVAKVPGTEVLGIFPHCLAADGDELTVITDLTCVSVDRKTGKITPLSNPADKFIRAESGIVAGKTTLYLVTEIMQNKESRFSGGVFRSIDAGEHWEKISEGIFENIPTGLVPIIRTIGVCNNQPETAYISMISNAKSRKSGLDSRYEIYKTVNAGVSWTIVYSANSKEVVTANFNDSWLHKNYGPGWGGDVLTLGVSPTNPDICYATDFGQAFKTLDGGVNWNQVCSQINPDGSLSTTGLDLTCCYGVIFDPFDINHLIVSYIDIGLFHSFDGGKSWQQLRTGIPDNWVNTCYDVVFDPTVKGRVWSIWANKHSLPRKSQFGDGSFANYSGGVAFSEDGGRTWKKSNDGLPSGSICTDLLIDPVSPETARTLYLSTFNQGIYKSTDGGKSWEKTNIGLKENLYAWELRMTADRIYLLCVRGWKGEISTDGALYYSDDKANTWQVATMPEGVTAPNDLLINPNDPGHMYLSCWPKHKDDSDIRGGVYVTYDAGKSWKQTFDERVRVFASAFDTSDTKTVFINTFQNGAYKSVDSGKTWNRIEGYRFKWGHCVIPDPHHPGMIFLTTYGVSIYYGPDTGTPEEFGKIENIPESWW